MFSLLIVRVKLPEGFKVDELPAAVKIETCFGSYSSSFEVTNGLLIFTHNVFHAGHCRRSP